MSRAPLLLAVVAVVGLAACSSSGGGGAPPVSELGATETTAAVTEEATELDLAAVADGVIVPRYEAFRTESDQLAGAVDALCAAPAEPALDAAREQWRAARAAWRRTVAFGIGPAMDLRTMAAVDFATSPDKVASFLAGTEPVTAESVGNLGANARGLGAVEELLFGEGAGELAGTGGARRCAYAAAAARLVADAATEVTTAWTEGTGGSDPYRDQLDEDRQAGLNDLYNEVVRTLQGVADRQLGLALGDTSGEPDPAEADPGPARRALEDMLDDLDGVLASYGGVLQPAIARQSTDTATRARQELVAGQEQLAAVAGPLARAVADDPEGLAAAQARLKEAKRILGTEVASLLGLTLTFSDADGDS